MAATVERWDGSASRYSDSEYAKACVLDRNDCQDASDMSAKQRYSLPVANPGSSWSESPDPAGVGAAAQRLGQVSAGAGCKTAAAKRLMRCYSKIDSEAPDAVKQMAGRSVMQEQTPTENLIRAVMPGVELRFDENSDDGDAPMLFGHFARFDEWTEIDSVFEGRFMERVAPGAFKKTFRELRDKMRVLFQHGHDPMVGDKPIAEITDLREDDGGAAYEARLFNGLPDLVMDGLRAGQYGASFRFSIMKEQWDDEPSPSDYNPRGLPERTLKELRVPEFGPVTFPAYEGATAGVRSLTDDFIASCIRSNPDRVREMFEQATDLREHADALHDDDEAAVEPRTPEGAAWPRTLRNGSRDHRATSVLTPNGRPRSALDV